MALKKLIPAVILSSVAFSAFAASGGSITLINKSNAQGLQFVDIKNHSTCPPDIKPFEKSTSIDPHSYSISESQLAQYKNCKDASGQYVVRIIGKWGGVSKNMTISAGKTCTFKYFAGWHYLCV